jgi:ABC-2 type transport system ATP-binding protein
VSTAPAIEVQDLAKRYEPAGVDALRGITFTVDEGEIFGFLGRNGAGKSTTVRILTTLLRPTAGSARVLGLDIRSQPAAVRRVLGVALQEAALDELMTGREHLVLAARLGGLRRPAAEARATELLEAFGLVGAADRIAARYSGGMRRRLDVAMSLVRHPKVLFLDEPTTGLDPQSRRALWELIRDLRGDGATVFLTTQYLAEADELSDRVAVVHDGAVAAIGPSQELKDRFGSTTLRLRVGDPAAVVRIARVLDLDLDAVRAGDDGWITVPVGGGERAVPGMVARISAMGASVERLAVVPPSLEDVFVGLTGNEIESGAGAGDDGALSAVRRGMGVVAGGGR